MLLAALIAVQVPQTVQADPFREVVKTQVEGMVAVAVPKNYRNSREKFPLLIFLHGAGERGEDISKVLIHGPLKEIGKGRDLPFVVAAPQCPENQGWDAVTLDGLFQHLVRRYRIDLDRVYLTGLSMGGYGTWDWATRHPNRFAAIAPICGGGNPNRAGRIAHLPIWNTHGDADQAVPIAQSIRMIDAVRAAGGKPRFDIIQGGGHDVWTDLYAGNDLYAWFLTQRRAPKPPK
jgi:predicted peptidase